MAAPKPWKKARARSADASPDEESVAQGPIASMVSGFLAYGMSRGLPLEEILATVGLEPGDLVDPDRHLPASVMFTLWRVYMQRLEDPALPLHLATSFPRGRFGIVGQLMKCSTTVRHALEQNVRHGRLIAPHLSMALECSRPTPRVVLRHHAAVEKLGGGGATEFMVALLFREVSDLLGAPLAVREVTFKHAARSPAEPYERFFGAPVRFGCDENGLELPGAELDRPLLTPTPEVVRYLEAHAARLVEALPPVEAPIVQRVREILARALTQGPVDQGRVARLLGMGPRTLQRRLTEAGTTFNDLLDDMRRGSALRLLRSQDTTITDAAFMLGYSDVPSFYRAFKRWTGQTPQAWRSPAA
ncbi:MAG: AraC family transcriptional regulator [Polyangiaceae bacterium]|nr:AraC family transcriptional regulator [Polyangiaceae bacterium]